MISIVTKTKGAVDRNSVMSISQTRSQKAFTSQDITALNQSYTHKDTHASAARPLRSTPAARPPVRQPVRSAVRQPVQSAVHQPVRSAVRQPVQSAVRQPVRSAMPVSAPPLQHRLPVLKKTVQKGQKAQLCAGGSPGMLKACFGWNTVNAQCDADVSAFLLGADGKVPGDSWFVFYGQTESPDKSCRFQNISSADRESITIDFGRLHPDVKKIVFVLTIHEAFEKRLHFGMMKDAYIRILDQSNTEIVSFQIPEYYSNIISMMIGELYQYKDSWKFNAVGNGVSKDLAGLCALYGVEVSG